MYTCVCVSKYAHVQIDRPIDRLLDRFTFFILEFHESNEVSAQTASKPWQRRRFKEGKVQCSALDPNPIHKNSYRALETPHAATYRV